jgi:hypothetical protein
MAGVHKFYKYPLSKIHFKRLGTRRVTLNKFHIEDPQILGSTVQNLDAWDLSTPDFRDIYIFRRIVSAFEFRNLYQVGTLPSKQQRCVLPTCWNRQWQRIIKHEAVVAYLALRSGLSRTSWCKWTYK